MSNKPTTAGAQKPVVAVLSNVRLSSPNGFPEGKEARVLEEQLAMAKQFGITMFVFLGDGVDWGKRTINGYTLISGQGKTGRWVRKTFSFPDVVYNRIRSRNAEKQSAMRQLLNKFEHDPDIHLFNTRFLDKWEVYAALAADPLTSGMVPSTRLLSAVNLQRFLDAHSKAFIKPRNNNAGRGIIKVVRKSSSAYYYCHSESAPVQWRKCNSFSYLSKQLSNMIQGPDDYMVQAGIDLARLKGRVFDIRAQVQKDGNGRWVFTGANVRIAARDRFVTYDKFSAKTKLSFVKVMSIIAGAAEETGSKIESQLSDLYNFVPRVLEKDLGLSLAVLSIDIGVDTSGKVWIIEVSSKSDRFDENHIRVRHLRYLMEYFIYITGNKAKPI